jgi:hypothetical protein
MIENMECPGCGWTVEIAEVDPAASILYDKEPGAWVRQARELRIGSKVVLHHLCSNPQLGDSSSLEREDAWWPCQEPEREPDENARFDLNCSACARRWVQSRSN